MDQHTAAAVVSDSHSIDTTTPLNCWWSRLGCAEKCAGGKQNVSDEQWKLTKCTDRLKTDFGSMMAWQWQQQQQRLNCVDDGRRRLRPRLLTTRLIVYRGVLGRYVMIAGLAMAPHYRHPPHTAIIIVGLCGCSIAIAGRLTDWLNDLAVYFTSLAAGCFACTELIVLLAEASHSRLTWDLDLAEYFIHLLIP